MPGKIIAKSALVGLLGFTLAHAASFQSFEQSATNLGLANAGTGVTSDPSVQYYNPAATAFAPSTELGLSGILVDADINFMPIYSTNYAGAPIKNGNSEGPSTTNFLPSMFFIHPINDTLSFGFGVETPFGLSTDYNDDSLARYFATKSQIQTINLNPSIAIKITDNLSFGMGFDAQYLSAELDQAYDYSSLNSTYALGDAYIINKAHDWGYGWNTGVYYQYSPATKFGFAYHSQVSHDPSGNTTIENVDNSSVASQFINGYRGLVPSDVATSLTLPDYATLSAEHQLTPWWTMMSDVEFINWSELRSFTLTFTPDNPSYNALPATTTVLDYHNTWRIAAGQSFQVTSKWAVNMGVAFDESPVVDEYRDARIPDSNRYWLSFGTQYQFTKNLNLNFGYSHIFFDDSQINQKLPAPLAANLIASYEGSANLYGLQLNYAFS